MNSLPSRFRVFFCGMVAVALFVTASHAQLIETTGVNNHDFSGSGPWNLSDFEGLRIGSTGVGGMSITGGAVMNNLFNGTGTSGNGFLGSISTGQGTVTVSGTGSQWNNARSTEIGANGVGSLILENNGTLDSALG
jgi:T5SS/PEP-CTERM-associated repeat protein